jgi:tetratricopeptide (TPR) repeat protein
VELKVAVYTIAVLSSVALPATAYTNDAVISPNPAARAYFWEGIDALAEGDEAGAKDRFELAVGADEKCVLAYALLSQLAYAAHDEELSREYYDRMSEEPPELETLYAWAVEPTVDGNWAEAEARARELVEQYPQTLRAIALLHLLGRAQYYLGERDEAWETLNHAFMMSDLVPGTVPAYENEDEYETITAFVSGDTNSE